MIKARAAQYKLLWIGNDNLGVVAILLAEKWVDKVINISRVHDRMIAYRYWFKLLILQSFQFASYSVS